MRKHTNPSAVARATAVFGILSTLVACGGGAAPTGEAAGEGGGNAPEKSNISVAVLGVSGDLQTYIAQQKGYFERHGLEVKLTRVPPQARLSALSSKQVDFAFINTVSVLLAQSRDFQLSIVAPTNKTPKAGTGPDPTALWAGAQSGIHGPKDLVGRAIAVNSLKNINWLYAREWLSQANVDLDRVTFREVDFPQMPDQLLQGNVDAAFGTQPWQMELLEAEEIRVAGSPFSEVLPEAPISMYVSTTNFAETNPNVASAFASALQDALAFTQENPKEARDLWAERQGEEPGSTQDIPVLPWASKIDQAKLEATLELMVKHGLLDEPFEIDETFLLPVATNPPNGHT